jgi:hypothetical protein
MMLFLQPPAQYDHSYHGRVIERRLSQDQIMQMCHGAATACSWVSKGVCYLALPQNEKDIRIVAAMRRHETAHCNGWPHTHDGGHWVEYGRPPGVTVYKSGGTSLTLY